LAINKSKCFHIIHNIKKIAYSPIGKSDFLEF